MDKERMVEPSMDAMITTLRETHNAMEQTVNVAQGIVQLMKEGALLGQAGNEFQQAIEGVLIPKVKTLEKKVQEMEVDVNKAKERIKLAMAEAKARFDDL